MGLIDKLKGLGTVQDFGMASRINRLAQAGVETPAVIQRASPTGRTEIGGGQEYEFGVEVRPAGGAPYPASFTQFMHPGSMGDWVAPGAGVKLRVDPQDPMSMMVYGPLN